MLLHYSYDHPDAIAGSGSIGVEIMDQLPQTDVIMIPVGGGGLLTGITEYVKHVKPDTLIYVRNAYLLLCKNLHYSFSDLINKLNCLSQGIEPSRGCSFFKAMQNNQPYVTAGTMPCIADKLLIPSVGVNAFYTSHSNITKMVSSNI